MSINGTQLTGRRRYYLYANQLILEVEVSTWDGVKWVCEWRDATPDDVPAGMVVNV